MPLAVGVEDCEGEFDWEYEELAVLLSVAVVDGVDVRVEQADTVNVAPMVGVMLSVNVGLGLGEYVPTLGEDDTEGELDLVPLIEAVTQLLED